MGVVMGRKVARAYSKGGKRRDSASEEVQTSAVPAIRNRLSRVCSAVGVQVVDNLILPLITTLAFALKPSVAGPLRPIWI